MLQCVVKERVLIRIILLIFVNISGRTLNLNEEKRDLHDALLNLAVNFLDQVIWCFSINFGSES